jgi:hypothetical protein
MRRAHRSCLSHSNLAISETYGRVGAIHNQTTPVGTEAMAGGFLRPDESLGNGTGNRLPRLKALAPGLCGKFPVRK